jgi:hypothetical protein
VPFCLTWSLYFLFGGINKANKWISALYFTLAGAFFGLGFHTYIAFRIAPVILLPIITIEIAKYWPKMVKLCKKEGCWGFLKEAYAKDAWWRWDIFFIAIILAALPLALYYIQNPADFMGRAGQVSIFASGNPVKTLAESTIKTLGQFVAIGDHNWRHNLSGSPEVFWPEIPLFLIGIGYFIYQFFSPKNYKKKNYGILLASWTLLAWWGSMLMPSIMTNEGLPHALRSIGAVVPTFIFVAFGGILAYEWLLSKFNTKNFALVLNIILIIAAVCLVGVEYWRYFIYWGQNPETRGAMTQKYVDEANYLNALSSTVKKYVLVNEGGVPVPYPDGVPVSSETINFLTRSRGTSVSFIKENETSKLLTQKYPGQAVILPMSEDKSLFSNLKQRFPQGNIEKLNGFSVFEINF